MSGLDWSEFCRYIPDARDRLLQIFSSIGLIRSLMDFVAGCQLRLLTLGYSANPHRYAPRQLASVSFQTATTRPPGQEYCVAVSERSRTIACLSRRERSSAFVKLLWLFPLLLGIRFLNLLYLFYCVRVEVSSSWFRIGSPDHPV